MPEQIFGHNFFSWEPRTDRQSHVGHLRISFGRLEKKFYVTPFLRFTYTGNVKPKKVPPSYLIFHRVIESCSCLGHVTRGTVGPCGGQFQPVRQCVSIIRNSLICARNPIFTCISLYQMCSLCCMLVILTQLIIIYIYFVIKCHDMTVGMT